MLLTTSPLQVSVENMGLYEDLSSAKDVTEVMSPRFCYHLWPLACAHQAQAHFLGLSAFSS